MNCDAEIAMTPDRNVDAALNARSACPIPPCWIGLGLLTPDFVRDRPARPLLVTTDGAFAGATERDSEGDIVDAAFDGAFEGVLVDAIVAVFTAILSLVLIELGWFADSR